MGRLNTTYGQVEPNHLSAQRNGQIYAQLPAAAAITVLENGQFVKYDYGAGVVDFTGAGEWMLVFNEVKTYRADETAANFALKAADQNAYIYDAAGHPMVDKAGTPNQLHMVPRVFKTSIGDIYTTDCVNIGSDTYNTVAVGDVYTPALSTESTPGILREFVASGEGADAATAMKWEIVAKCTLPDGRNGVKLMRIQ